MKNKWVIILGISLITLTGCAQDQTQDHSSQEQEQMATGPEKVYQENCMSCHGGDLQGGYGPSLQKIGSKYDAAEITNIIQNGKGSMPALSQIPKGDQEKLAKWLAEKK